MNESRRIYPDLYGDRGPTTLAWETDGKVSRGREEPREPGRATFLTRRVTVLRIKPKLVFKTTHRAYTRRQICDSD